MNIIIDDTLHLEEVSVAHAKSLFQIINRERAFLGKWLPFVSMTKEIADTESYILSLVNAPAALFEYVFTIVYQNNIIGLVGFVRSDTHNKKTEIGYWMSEKHQRKGIMTKSVQELINFGFTELDMNRIQIKCAVGNTPSSNIPKRLNFIFEGIERQGELQANGSYKDLEIYSLLKSDI